MSVVRQHSPGVDLRGGSDNRSDRSVVGSNRTADATGTARHNGLGVLADSRHTLGPRAPTRDSGSASVAEYAAVALPREFLTGWSGRRAVLNDVIACSVLNCLQRGLLTLSRQPTRTVVRCRLVYLQGSLVQWTGSVYGRPILMAWCLVPPRCFGV